MWVNAMQLSNLFRLQLSASYQCRDFGSAAIELGSCWQQPSTGLHKVCAKSEQWTTPTSCNQRCHQEVKESSAGTCMLCLDSSYPLLLELFIASEIVIAHSEARQLPKCQNNSVCETIMLLDVRWMSLHLPHAKAKLHKVFYVTCS